ncbi:hypothetical protein BH20VER3_BH20VER3_23500 [soil metagenome]
MSLLRNLFWFLLFVFFTFCFVVLFQYGPSEFVPGLQKEFSRVTKYVQNTIQPAKKKSDEKNP